MELDDVGLSLGSRGAGDQGPSGGRLGRSGRLFGVELDDPPRRTPLQCISARIWSVPLHRRRRGEASVVSVRGLGVEIDRNGKIPDVVIHHVERNWLILIEAVTSHGPVNLLRLNQLKDLFAVSRAGLVFVTTFLDRASMREYLPEIAWETEVWVADAPDHLIHFNGERFLGPYEEE